MPRLVKNEETKAATGRDAHTLAHNVSKVEAKALVHTVADTQAEAGGDKLSRHWVMQTSRQ